MVTRRPRIRSCPLIDSTGANMLLPINLHSQLGTLDFVEWRSQHQRHWHVSFCQAQFPLFLGSSWMTSNFTRSKKNDPSNRISLHTVAICKLANTWQLNAFGCNWFGSVTGNLLETSKKAPELHRKYPLGFEPFHGNVHGNTDHSLAIP